MVEVFTTNIPNKTLGKQMVKSLKKSNSFLEIDFDIEKAIVNYPLSHSILRVEGQEFDAHHIISFVNDNGYKCHILEDKINY